jgi:glycosyltransferase involved in cell wall biosynthesis
MNKLVALLRVKDGILFVEEWLSVMEKLVDEFVVVDNGSRDGTLEILKEHPKVVDIVQTQGFDEGRDKILVYEMARKRNPDWCIWLDVDEIFEQRITRKIMIKLMNSKKYTRYLFRRFDFVRDYHHYIFYFQSIAHSTGFSRSMWREQSTGYFNNVIIHNGDIQGITGKFKRLNYRLKHLGYVDRQYVERKTTQYISVDPKREKLYLRHFDKTPGLIFTWYEYNEKPIFVKTQMLLYNGIFYLVAFKNKSWKIIRCKTQKWFDLHFI